MYKQHYSIFKKVIASISFAALCAIPFIVMSSCSTTQMSQAEATISDAFAAGAVIYQAYEGLTIPSSSLQTGNSQVDKYLSTATTALTSPVTQKLVTDIQAIASSNPTSIPTVPITAN